MGQEEGEWKVRRERGETQGEKAFLTILVADTDNYTCYV